MLPHRLPQIDGRRQAETRRTTTANHDHAAIDEVLTTLAMAAAAGARPREGLAIVSATGSGSLAAAMRPCVERIDRGADLAAALRTMDAADRRVRQLHRILEQADVDGTTYAATVETLRDDVRRERLTELEVAAQRLSVAIQFPLVLCILPSFIVLALVPLVLALIDDLAI